MRDRLLLFAKLFGFWMLVMSVGRICFLVYNYDLSSSLSAGEITLSLMHGLKMDLSMTGYAMALTGLLLTLSVFVPGRWIVFCINSFTLLFLVTCVVIVIIDMELYRHWGFRMNTTPLFYMGSEAIGSIDVWVATKTLVIGIILFVLLSWLYFKLITPQLKNLRATEKKVAFILLPVTVLMFLFIRGSVSVAPMNTGFVYFHKTKMYANHAAINVVWNFFKSLSRTSHIEYPENFFDKSLTEKYFNELHPKQDSGFSILNTPKPNVILIIVESFTADVVEPLGGVPDICPRFNSLCSEGILFDNFYSSGDRTDKGIVSILSGYPAQPNSSIIKYPQKSQHLPFLNRSMMALGYKTSFTYGGDADFANFRSFLTASGFGNITDTDDFDSKLNTSKWGVHDGFMLKRALQEIDTAHAPYFKVILTQSSHEPFDVPMKPLLPNTSRVNQFLNSFHYTDSCLGAFIDVLKSKEDWKNTLVLITADHGHPYPGDKPLQSKERFHIPFLMLGGALSKDSVIHTIGNQTDIANTLLAQIAKADEAFVFSNDLFNANLKEHAVFYFTDGYGFVLPDKFLVYDNIGKQFIKKENTTLPDEELSKAYQQKLYGDFNKR
ncbi:MAG TPA: sulfatase-like hydrolase/transferase [Chryseolinea sp.]|nr:sulfatase-like hydrolase/transferase [Chryseolinea sp.]HPM28824.1 sulfatase-like hydrolase/transferase [Chryseolinea sp.]